MTEIRIAFIVRDITTVGGAQLSALRLADYLRQNNCRVILIGQGKSSEIISHLNSYRILSDFEIKAIPPPPFFLKKIVTLFPNIYFWFLSSIYLFKLRHKYDVIHAPLLSESLIPCVLINLLTDKVNIIKLGSSGSYGDVSRFLKNKSYVLMNLLLSGVSCFVCPSSAIQSELIQTLKIKESKIRLISNGIDTNYFKPASSLRKKNLRMQFGLSDSDKIVLFVGRLQEKKRVPFLLKGWQRLCKSAKTGNLLLLICGDGGLHTELVSMAEQLSLANRVQFLGNQKDIRQLMQLSDIFVLPSVSEGMSNACLEAMATALPVVATKIRGNLSVISNNENGLLFDTDDLNCFVNRLLYLLRNPEYARRLGNAARQTVVAEYAIDHTAHKYKLLYNELITRQ